MTGGYLLPIEVHRETVMRVPRIGSPSEISVLIPCYDDPEGLALTLRSIWRVDPPPNRIVVVDDGSPSPIQSDDPRVEVVHRERNGGAAAARNTGLAHLDGWVLLTDAGCVIPPDLLEEYHHASQSAPPDVVALCGPVVAYQPGRIGRYMTEQENLCPPQLSEGAQTVVTANCLVHTDVLRHVGGFDESFPSAGGEDYDLGLRMRRVGILQWVPQAMVQHSFDEDLGSFEARFRRYGRGLRLLARKWGVDLTPFDFEPHSPDLTDLARLQVAAMTLGYQSSIE